MSTPEEKKKLGLQAILNQVDREMASESLDHRRVRQLKAQIIQLEKQIIVMANSLSDYKQRTLDAEATVLQLLNYLRVAMDADKGSRNVTFSKSDLSTQINQIDNLIKRLSSVQGEHCDFDAEIFSLNKRFLRKGHSVLLSEICSGNIKHINLSKVTALEQRLACLYGDLSRLEVILNSSFSEGQRKFFEEVRQSVQLSCDDLLSLSLLVPNVPWLKNSALPEITAEAFMSALPKLTTAKHNQVKAVIDTTLKLSEYRHRTLTYKLAALETEMAHFLSLKWKKERSVDEIVSALVAQHKVFYDNLLDTLIQPVAAVLERYNKLAELPSDEHLKNFLGSCKELFPQISTVTESFSSHKIDENVIKLMTSSYEKELQAAVEKLKLQSLTLKEEEDKIKQLEFSTTENLTLLLSSVKSPKVQNVRRDKSDVADSVLDVALNSTHCEGQSSLLTEPLNNQSTASSFISKMEHVYGLNHHSAGIGSVNLSSESNDQTDGLTNHTHRKGSDFSHNTISPSDAKSVRKPYGSDSTTPNPDTKAIQSDRNSIPTWLKELKDDLNKQAQPLKHIDETTIKTSRSEKVTPIMKTKTNYK